MSARSVPAVERVLPDGAPPMRVGESPVWHAQQQALYWVDIPARTILRLHPASGRLARWALAEQVACLAFDRHGTVLAGCESGLFAVTLGEAGDDIVGDDADKPGLSAASGGAGPAAQSAVRGGAYGRLATRRLAAPVFPAAGMRFNDGRCDRQGRFWSGTMVQDMAAARSLGALYRYDARRGLSAPVVDGLIVQNGLGWSPDGRTMYLSDSHASRRLIWAFDYDTDAGEPHGRRVFADLHAFAGRPDGAAVDADGCYWICANDAGRVLRLTPAGELDREIRLPATKPSMCAFGGPSLDTLFVTTIRPAESATEHDGQVFAVRPGVRGLPEPLFAGELQAGS